MNRRELLIGAGAVLAAGAAGSMAEAAGGHEHHHHGMGGGYSALIDAATECHKVAMACESHCFDTFAKGDTSLAECAREVNEMMALCDATVRSASLNGKQTKNLIKLCMEAGKSCEDECRKHQKKHDICRVAADACAKCVEECKKALG